MSSIINSMDALRAKLSPLSGSEIIILAGTTPEALRTESDYLVATFPFQAPYDQASACIVVCIRHNIKVGADIVKAAHAINRSLNHDLIGVVLKKRTGTTVGRHMWTKDAVAGFALL